MEESNALSSSLVNLGFHSEEMTNSYTEVEHLEEHDHRIASTSCLDHRRTRSQLEVEDLGGLRDMDGHTLMLFVISSIFSFVSFLLHHLRNLKNCPFSFFSCAFCHQSFYDAVYCLLLARTMLDLQQCCS